MLGRPSSNIRQNGVTRPKHGTTTAKIWEIADELSMRAGKPAERYQVLDACRAYGLVEGTASTQYARWRKFYSLGRTKRLPVVQAAEATAKPA